MTSTPTKQVRLAAHFPGVTAGAEDLILTTTTQDHADWPRSCELLAGEWS